MNEPDILTDRCKGIHPLFAQTYKRRATVDKYQRGMNAVFAAIYGGKEKDHATVHRRAESRREH